MCVIQTISSELFNYFVASEIKIFFCFSRESNKQKRDKTADAVARDVVAEDVLVLLVNHGRGQASSSLLPMSILFIVQMPGHPIFHKILRSSLM